MSYPPCPTCGGIVRHEERTFGRVLRCEQCGAVRSTESVAQWATPKEKQADSGDPNEHPQVSMRRKDIGLRQYVMDLPSGEIRWPQLCAICARRAPSTLLKTATWRLSGYFILWSSYRSIRYSLPVCRSCAWRARLSEILACAFGAAAVALYYRSEEIEENILAQPYTPFALILCGVALLTMWWLHSSVSVLKRGDGFRVVMRHTAFAVLAAKLNRAVLQPMGLGEANWG